MHSFKKQLTGLILALCLLLALCVPAQAATPQALDAAFQDTAAYLVKQVPQPQVGSVGGEWAVIGLARAEANVPAGYYDGYYAALVKTLQANQGVLHDKKYTEYSRVILALTAIGRDPANVAGYNLLQPLGDYEKTVWQGLNGAIWALIALDSRDYAIPQSTHAQTQATRDLYVRHILDRQLADGGWALSGDAADPDMTGMALQALANYQSRSEVKAATERALICLSKLQSDDGGFSSWGVPNSESVVQVIVALTALGVDLSDSRFVKGEKTLADGLLAYYTKGGGFTHELRPGFGNDQMSSEQGFYALVAMKRAAEGKASLYRMNDVQTSAPTPSQPQTGKDPAVTPRPVVNPNVSFSDVENHPSRTAILDLASRDIINGMGDGSFRPDESMTRAQFATIVVKALGLSPRYGGRFSDVAATAWYGPYVDAAAAYGIVNGVGNGRFDPQGTITREQASAMVARAAALCGLNNALSEAEIRDMLAQFGDYTAVSAYARPTLAFCYQQNILSQADLNIRPQAAILRWEIASMLYNLLGAASLR